MSIDSVPYVHVCLVHAAIDYPEPGSLAYCAIKIPRLLIDDNLSVFECVPEPAQLATLKQTLSNLIDRARDSLRSCFLGADCNELAEHVGSKTTEAQRES